LRSDKGRWTADKRIRDLVDFLDWASICHHTVTQCRPMNFQIVGNVSQIETIAAGTAVRESQRLRKLYGGTRWRKLKGVALVRLRSGRIRKAELHWYEAHGVGKKEIKRKRYLD
jgi:hypothetical protein